MKDQEVVIEAKKTDGCILEVVLPQIVAASTHTVVYLFSTLANFYGLNKPYIYRQFTVII